MRRLIIFLAINCLIFVNSFGQSLNENEILTGVWYACGLTSIQIQDTITFTNKDSNCQNNECLAYKWIIDNKFRMGWQKGCDDIKIGYGFRDKYKWKIDHETGLLTIKKSHSNEEYKILTLINTELKVIRIE